jgi:hypothetical protein
LEPPIPKLGFLPDPENTHMDTMLEGITFTTYLTNTKTMAVGKATRQKIYLQRREHLKFDIKGYRKNTLRYRQITQCYPAGTEFRPRCTCVTIIKRSCCKMNNRG